MSPFAAAWLALLPWRLRLWWRGERELTLAEFRARVRARFPHGARIRSWRKVLRRDPCAYCGGPAGTVDHIRPRKRGWPLSCDNATSACRTCNTRKGHAALLRFLWESRHVAEIERLTGRPQRDCPRSKAWRRRPRRPDEVAHSSERKAAQARGYVKEMERLLQVALEAQAAGKMGPPRKARRR